MMEKSKQLPPAYPVAGNCSYSDTLPPPYADTVTPQLPPVFVPQQQEQNTWAYELFYCFTDIPTCLVEICLPCAAEVSFSAVPVSSLRSVSATSKLVDNFGILWFN